jgi:SAM-dependent methyltransferase
MLLEILDPVPELTCLDLGCGEGRVMRSVSRSGAEVHGVELNPYLARLAARTALTMIGELPDLGFIREDSYDAAYCVLVLEHIEDHRGLFDEVARVVQTGGRFAVVMNHPVWTAPGSTPVTDHDGETLWRPGAYFRSGTIDEPAGEQSVVFHHRTMAELANAAAGAGWALEEMVEAPHHDLYQPGIPRLLACRWRLLP